MRLSLGCDSFDSTSLSAYSFPCPSHFTLCNIDTNIYIYSTDRTTTQQFNLGFAPFVEGSTAPCMMDIERTQATPA
jgi:hypothetical protein